MFLKAQNEYKIVGGDQDNIHKRLPGGSYKVDLRESMFSDDLYLIPIQSRKDMRMLNGGVFKEINKYISDFLDPAMYAARDFLGTLHKLPLLFYGTQGSGKTQHALLWGDKLVKEQDAVVLIMTGLNPKINLSYLVDSVREKEPDRLVVLILDEFEKSGSRHMTSSSMLSFLDGPDSRNNLLLIATCNDTSAMPDLLLDRPGRFEKVFTLMGGNLDVLRATVVSLLPDLYKNRIDIEAIVKELADNDKWTIDYVRLFIRNAIAELIHYDKTGSFVEFNGVFDKKIEDIKEESKGKKPKVAMSENSVGGITLSFDEVDEEGPCYNCDREIDCVDCEYSDL